jgi:hypothetical protein
MAEQARPSTLIFDFPGMTNDPRSSINQVPGTAAEQINACSVILGELLVRKGIREVTFEQDS